MQVLKVEPRSVCGPGLPSARSRVALSTVHKPQRWQVTKPNFVAIRHAYPLPLPSLSPSTAGGGAIGDAAAAASAGSSGSFPLT
eukprot:362077-Chlamydomonas_euryale.AAC.19